jgi:hypothetical protein
MKLAYAFIGLLIFTGCEGNKNPAPESRIVSGAPTTTMPAPVPGNTLSDQDALNDRFPAQRSGLGPTEAELKFVQAGRALIAALNLPSAPNFQQKMDSSKQAKHFVGFRCSSMLRKMKTAPKSFTNLYDDSELGRVCDASSVTLIPGQAVSSVDREGIVFTTGRTSIEISVRPDSTVSGFRVIDTESSIIREDSTHEHVVTLEGDRRIETQRSRSLRSLQVNDQAGRISYSEVELFGSQSRDSAVRKLLVVRGMRDNRTLSILEAVLTPAPGFLGLRKETTVRCDIRMLNADGSIHAQVQVSETCFPQSFGKL